MLAPETDLTYTVSIPEAVTTFVTIQEITPVGASTISSLRTMPDVAAVQVKFTLVVPVPFTAPPVVSSKKNNLSFT